MLTFEEIKELINLVAERRLQGLEVERSGFRLKIDGQAPLQPAVHAAPAAHAAPHAHPSHFSDLAPSPPPARLRQPGRRSFPRGRTS